MKTASTLKPYQEYEQMAGLWLHRGNLAAERGNHELAERHYEKSQKWLDKATDARGWGDSSDG